jgi:putative ABC transport system ATP-binding protein
MALMECIAVTKTYRLGKVEVPALRELSCSFSKGEFVALMGPSGSGKSTLLNILGLIDEPSSGEVLFDSVPLRGKGDYFLTKLRGRNIGFIFQAFNLVPILTIRENIEFPLSRTEFGVREIRRRSDALLEETGLGGLGSRYPNEVSGGQRQRAAIARALIHAPGLILADEPTANLDTETGKAVVGLLHELTRKKDSTVILATHDPEIVNRSDRLVSLRDGALSTHEGGVS